MTPTASLGQPNEQLAKPVEEQGAQVQDDKILPNEILPGASPPAKKKQKVKTPHVSHQFTLRKPSWIYFHLSLFSTTQSDENIDVLTARRHLTSALSRFLGLHGTAIPVDILKLERTEAWIRVPREDGMAVHEALSGWMGGSEETGVRWLVEGRDEWLMRLTAGNGQDLFRP